MSHFSTLSFTVFLLYHGNAEFLTFSYFSPKNLLHFTDCWLTARFLLLFSLLFLTSSLDEIQQYVF